MVNSEITYPVYYSRPSKPYPLQLPIPVLAELGSSLPPPPPPPLPRVPNVIDYRVFVLHNKMHCTDNRLHPLIYMYCYSGTLL